MIVEFQTERASRYLEDLFGGYLKDPADSDFQRGFLSAALVIYREGLGKGVGDDRLALLDRQVSARSRPSSPSCRTSSPSGKRRVVTGLESDKMNKAVARLLTLGIKVRTLWLAVLLGIAIGFYLALGWAYVVLKSPEVALSLIERVQG